MIPVNLIGGETPGYFRARRRSYAPRTAPATPPWHINLDDHAAICLMPAGDRCPPIADRLPCKPPASPAGVFKAWDPSPAKTRSDGTIAFVGKANAKKADE